MESFHLHPHVTDNNLKKYEVRQQGGAPSFVGNSDNSAMYDPAKLAGLNTDYMATPATSRRKGKLTE